MRKIITLYLPILAVFFANVVLFGWSSAESGIPIYDAVNPFSFIVSL